jgi:peptide deformylase
MDLIYYPNPILRKRASPLPEITDAVRQRVTEMFPLMYKERGVGLAAPQVGWSVRLFTMNALGEDDPTGEKVYINPEIVRAEGEVLDEEGCLSIPDVRGKVLRSRLIVIRALDLQGKSFEEELQDLEARVVQHELDHLDGILFVSRLSASERLLVGKSLKKLEKEYKSSVALRAGL